jgi:hypothetical protein
MNIRIMAVIIAIIAIGSMWFALEQYNNMFSGGLSSQHQRWAEFGGFFGGVTSSVFAFLALLTLLVTLDVQHIELKETRNLLKRQKFETTFFELLKKLDEKMETLSNSESSIGLAAPRRIIEGKPFISLLARDIRTRLFRGDYITKADFASGYVDNVWPKCPSLIEFYSIFVFIGNYINEQNFSDEEVKIYNDLLATYITQNGLLLVVSHSFSVIADASLRKIATQFSLVERISDEALKGSINSLE